MSAVRIGQSKSEPQRTYIRGRKYPSLVMVEDDVLKNYSSVLVSQINADPVLWMDSGRII